ncbi:hypothetical protein CASFOL_014909 [Castilleja foliolosa]|uniref:Uncharacterized protein n=1 Tax=Castilleja foliolosa TaxID=1961234 RepID=A0ABD3DG78_9LAMI
MATIRRMDEPCTVGEGCSDDWCLFLGQLAVAGGGGGQLNRRKVFSTAGAWTKVEQVSGCWAPI